MEWQWGTELLQMPRKNPAWQALQSTQRAKQKLGHGIRKQQALRVLGAEGRSWPESPKWIQEAVYIWRHSRQAVESLGQTRGQGGSDTVKSHKDLCPKGSVVAGRLLWCHFIFQVQRLKAGLTYRWNQLAATSERKKRECIGTKKGQKWIVRILGLEKAKLNTIAGSLS